MEYKVSREYWEQGLHVTIERPILSQPERLEQSQRVARQLRQILHTHQQRVEGKDNT